MKNPNSIAHNVVDGYVISTVKLAGRMYETMVFHADSDGEVRYWVEVDSRHYATEAAAHDGHAVMVATWRNSKTTVLS